MTGRVMLVYQPVDGGVGRHVRDLAEGLHGRGHEIVLCGPAPPNGIATARPGITHIRLDLGRAIAPRADLRAASRLAAIVRRTEPTLVHAHSSKAGALARLARLARLRLPVLYTPHGYAFAGFFSSELARTRYRAIERALAPFASRVVCVCQAEAALAATLGSDRRVRVVYNGVAVDDGGPPDPCMAELAKRGPLICALTQLRGGKGIETLIDAAAAIHARNPVAQVVVWGDGPESRTLRARAWAAGLGEVVHFPGACNDPLRVLRGADVFVHPSLAESFPYVVLEAMAAGRPIVASDVGGIGEALGGEAGKAGEGAPRDGVRANGAAGLLVAPGDAQALAHSVNDLLENPERGARLGAVGRLRVQERFNLATMIDRLLEVYSEVSG